MTVFLSLLHLEPLKNMTLTSVEKNRITKNKRTQSATDVARRAQTKTNARISLDIGYHTCVAYDGTTAKTIRSVYAKLPTGQKSPNLPNSFVVQFKGERYLVGEGAMTRRNYSPFANEDKLSNHILKMALYVLCGDGKVDLVVSHYDSSEHQPILEATLGGTHTFVLDGQKTELDVRRVTVLDEGKGSWLLASHKNMLASKGYTAIVDLGCDTFIVSFYDTTGLQVEHQPYPQQGVKSLAAAIASDARLAGDVGKLTNRSKPAVAIVLDGFANDHYYAQTPATWASYFDEYRDEWFKSVFNSIKNDFSHLIPMTQKFIVTGGGAHLVANKLETSSAFAVMDKPEVANAIGAFYVSEG